LILFGNFSETYCVDFTVAYENSFQHVFSTIRRLGSRARFQKKTEQSSSVLEIVVVAALRPSTVFFNRLYGARLVEGRGRETVMRVCVIAVARTRVIITSHFYETDSSVYGWHVRVAKKGQVVGRGPRRLTWNAAERQWRRMFTERYECTAGRE